MSWLKRKNNRKRRPRSFETLENRSMLAGVVTVDMDDNFSVLTLTGDDAGNGLEVSWEKQSASYTCLPARS